jgi:hypothetical protein
MNGSCSPRRATEHARGAFTRMWFHGDSSVLRLLVTRGMSSVRSMELGSVTFKRIGFFVFQLNTQQDSEGFFNLFFCHLKNLKLVKLGLNFKLK